MHNRELYERKVCTQLDEWKAQIELARAKAASASVDRRMELNDRVRELEKSYEEAKARLDTAAETTDDAWDSVERDAESAWDTLKNSVNDLIDRVARD